MDMCIHFLKHFDAFLMEYQDNLNFKNDCSKRYMLFCSNLINPNNITFLVRAIWSEVTIRVTRLANRQIL